MSETPPLRTIEEFRVAAEASARQSLRMLVFGIAGMFGLMLLSLVATKLLEGPLGKVVSGFIPAALFLLSLPVFFYGAWRADQVQKRCAELQCPHCGKSLMNRSGIVIASRNCPHCGRRILSDPPPVERVDSA